MDLLTIVYLIYSFVALYFIILFIMIYLPNKESIFSFPKAKKNYSLSIVVPCYNEAKTIKDTIESILNLGYEGLEKIIVVDDCSTDGSYEIIKQCAKKFPKVVALRTPKNTGKASGAKNYGAKFVKTELIGFTDGDSYPVRGSIQSVVGFFDDTKTSAVTSVVLVKKRDLFIERLQSIEYKIIAFTRKLLGYVDAIYVTPGPLAIYRKSVFDELGGFDEKNMTEDIEITWAMIAKGYSVKMSMLSKVYTIAPDNIKDWFKQRVRWNIGGLQTMSKYKKSFMKQGILGFFILPLFVSSWAIGIAGLFFLIYRFFLKFYTTFLSTAFAVQSQTAIVTLRDINLTPNVLIFFGAALLFLSLTFTIIALIYSREEEYKNPSLFSLIVYIFFYLLLYPVILIFSIYKFFKGGYVW